MMKRIFTNIKKIGFSAKMFIGVFFLGIVLITTMQLIHLNNLTEHQKKVIEQQITDDIEKCNIFLNNYYDMTIQMLISLSTRDDIFTLPKDEAVIVLESIASSSMLVRNLYIIRDDGSILSNQHTLFDVFGNPELNKAILESTRHPNTIRYTQPYMTRISSEYTICFIYPLQADSRIIAIELNLRYVREYLDQVLSGTNRAYALKAAGGNIFLFDRRSKVIPIKTGVYPVEMADSFIEAIAFSGSTKTTVTPPSIPGYQVKFSADNHFNWSLYTFWSDDDLNKTLAPHYTNFFLNTALWIIALAAVGFALMFIFTQPLRRLTQAIEQVSDFDSLIPLNYKREDEIGRLTKSYNRLVAKIQELIVDVKTTEHKKSLYEFQMLQNQIGPHFLHNTLACIGSLIRQAQYDKAAAAVRSLSELLSFSFSRGPAEVTLSDELKCLRCYLDIQKIRHGDIFKVIEEVTPDASKCIVPKLTLQPLVENAILHGLLPKDGNDKRIVIRAFVARGHLFIFIADNGVGMTVQKCAAILAGKGDEKVGSRFSSIGVSNVSKRISLSYGDKYHLKIRSCRKKGTVVRIKIPVQAEQRQVKNT